MTATRKLLKENLKKEYISCVSNFLKERGEDVLVTASNEIALPVVDAAGNEEFIVLKFVIPSGSRDGDIYDGYTMAQDYAQKLSDKASKAEAAAIAKAKKIERDAKMRAAKAELKLKHQKIDLE